MQKTPVTIEVLASHQLYRDNACEVLNIHERTPNQTSDFTDILHEVMTELGMAIYSLTILSIRSDFWCAGWTINHVTTPSQARLDLTLSPALNWMLFTVPLCLHLSLSFYVLKHPPLYLRRLINAFLTLTWWVRSA